MPLNCVESSWIWGNVRAKLVVHLSAERLSPSLDAARRGQAEVRAAALRRAPGTRSSRPAPVSLSL